MTRPERRILHAWRRLGVYAEAYRKANPLDDQMAELFDSIDELFEHALETGETAKLTFWL